MPASSYVDARKHIVAPEPVCPRLPPAGGRRGDLVQNANQRHRLRRV
jgi:hypothetical protein